jgi:hypothetical protein
MSPHPPTIMSAKENGKLVINGSGGGSPTGEYPDRRLSVDDFKPGDRVRWSSHGGEAVGEVVKKITSDTEAGGRTVRARKDEPQYLVRSDNGGEAVHKPAALRSA